MKPVNRLVVWLFWELSGGNRMQSVGVTLQYLTGGISYVNAISSGRPSADVVKSTKTEVKAGAMEGAKRSL